MMNLLTTSVDSDNCRGVEGMTSIPPEVSLSTNAVSSGKTIVTLRGGSARIFAADGGSFLSDMGGETRQTSLE